MVENVGVIDLSKRNVCSQACEPHVQTLNESSGNIPLMTLSTDYWTATPSRFS